MKVSKILSAILLIAAWGCDTKDETSHTASAGHELTPEQIKLAGIITGSLEQRLVSAVISCTGEIEIPPRGMASVTAPLGGYIVDTDMVPGRFVKKGALLAKLRNPEYIILQQSYLETLGQLKFAGQEFERQRLLNEENATAVKKLQESESAFSVLKARLAGLKEQLKLVGIDLRQLELGDIQSVVTLRSPITGFVTSVNHHPGQFVEPRDVIFEVVDMNDLHLHLNVFEQDVSRVLKDQVILFHPAGTKGEKFSGKVSLVSPKKNDDIRTFDVHGHIEAGERGLKPGMYVEAEILVSDDSVYALPQTAVVNANDSAFVITEMDGEYSIEAVETGVKRDGWVEIRNAEFLHGKDIVMQGTSRLFAALNREKK